MYEWCKHSFRVENQSVGVVVKDIALGVRGSWFISRVSQIRRSVTIAAMFLWSCVALALSRTIEPRRLLNVSAYKASIYNEFFF